MIAYYFGVSGAVQLEHKVTYFDLRPEPGRHDNKHERMQVVFVITAPYGDVGERAGEQKPVNKLVRGIIIGLL